MGNTVGQGLAPWWGGKRNLAELLTARIEAIPHDLYAKPFVGMGGVFFRRRWPARVEALNDRAGDVVNLFRIVRHHPEALLDELRLQLVSREDFERLLKVDPTTLTDVQRAARLFALQRLRYGGKTDSATFPARRTRPDSFDAVALRRLITAAHDRLARVTIEHLDYADFIRRYDRPSALFYLDPSYWGCETDYGLALFERADFERLAGQLRGLKGRFLLSLNDTPEVRQTFTGFAIEEVEITYTIANGSNAMGVRELIISTAGLPEAKQTSGDEGA